MIGNPSFCIFRSICTTKRAKWMSIFFLLIPFLFHLLNVFRINYKVQWIPCGVGYVPVPTESRYGSSPYTQILVGLILNLILQIIFPYILVVVSNTILIIALIKALKNRSKLTGKCLMNCFGRDLG